MPSRRDYLSAVGGAAALGGVGFLLSDRRLPGTCPARTDPVWGLRGENWTTPEVGTDTLVLGEWFATTGIRRTARLVALDPWNGSPTWARTVTGAGWGRPAVTEGAVYAGTGNESVHAFDRITGDTLWTWDESDADTIGGGAWAQPAVADGTVFVPVSTAVTDDPDPSDETDYGHRVVALDTADGTVRWTADVDGMAFSDPVVASGVLVVATESGTVYGLDPGDGSERWVVTRDSDVRQPTVEHEGRVVVADREAVVALDAGTGEMAWTATAPGATTVAACGDRLFVGDDEGNAVSYGLGDGEERWQFRAEAPVGGIGVADDSSVEAHVVDQIGYVYSVTDAGKREHRFRISENRSDNRCGWIPDRRTVNGVTARPGSLTVSTRWGAERFSLDFD